MIRRRTITSYVWNSVSGNKMVILLNCIRNFFQKFELLGNSVQGENPAPDNPQEIKSAGRKSKNLFNIADLRVGQVQKDGTINEKSTHYRTAILDVPEDAKYRITFKTNTDYNMIYFTHAYINGVYSNPYVKVYGGNSNSLISLKNGKNILSFRATKDDAIIGFPKDHNIMIAAESETLDYEPYGYFFDLKITGKNLFDREKARDITNWIVRDGNGYAKFPIRVGKGNKVTFYYSEKLTTGKGFYVGITQSETSAIVSWLYHSAETNLNNKKYTAVAAGDYIYLSCTISGIQKFVDTIQTLQVEIGSEQTEYEPYAEQSMQIVLDEPLRGVGEYKDTITKDGAVRKIKRAVFDGSEDEKWGLSREHENHINFALVIKGAITVNTGIRTMMDKFKYFGAIWNSDLLGQDMFGATLRINMPKTLATDLQTFKTWLSQNPLTVDYVLAEPVTEPLPESVQAQLSSLHSENGTTHVFVDSGEVEAGINIEYKYKS